MEPEEPWRHPARYNSNIRRLLPAFFLVLFTLSACSSWQWRVKSLTYPASDIAVPVFAGLEAADLDPEAYGVGTTEVEARNMDEVFALLAEEGRRRGAHAVVLSDFEAVTAQWATWHDSETEGSEVHRQETISTSSSSATVLATALRNSRWCVGATLVCDSVSTEGEACVVRVDRLVAGGPAEAAGAQVGNRVLQVQGTTATHPWDVHQWADHLGDTGLDLQLEDARASREVRVVPAPCTDLYGE